MLTTVFLDLDDTILDFQRAEAEALSKTMRHFGVNPTPDLLHRYHEINAAQWRLLEEGKITRPQLLVGRFRLLLEELELPLDSEAVCTEYETNLGRGHFFVPGAPALLETLSPRYDLYLATNGTAHIQRGRLESAGILPQFKGVFISQEVGADKPSPAFFRACFRTIPDFDPAASLMVGDSLTSDIRGAKAAGLRTCWFNPRGEAAPPELRPDYQVRALADLPELLETL